MKKSDSDNFLLSMGVEMGLFYMILVFMAVCFDYLSGR